MGAVAIIDYGMGNLASVQRAVQEVAPELAVRRVERPRELEGAHAVILPGVGAFGPAMDNLRRAGLDVALREWLAGGRPLLGVCLGFQLLFESSEEGAGPEGRPGLGWFAGRVRRFAPGVTVPHMGWNALEFPEDAPRAPLFEGLPTNGAYVYFAHSYYVEPADPGLVAAITRIDPRTAFASAVWRGRAGGVQFHPEKSGRVGLQVLRRFVQEAAVGAASR